MSHTLIERSTSTQLEAICSGYPGRHWTCDTLARACISLTCFPTVMSHTFIVLSLPPEAKMFIRSGCQSREFTCRPWAISLSLHDFGFRVSQICMEPSPPPTANSYGLIGLKRTSCTFVWHSNFSFGSSESW